MRTRLGNFLVVLMTFVLIVPAALAICAAIVGGVQHDLYPVTAGIGAIGVVFIMTVVAGSGRLWPALLTTPCGYLAAWGLASAVAAVDRNESAPVVIGAVAGVAGLVLGPLSSLLIPPHSPRRTVLDIFDVV
ncbi:hypothetical protein V6U77_06445 [Micromonospora sp. CPCC 205546]|uniref:hypothetical protein n=1 Tax=Micromonospora sp. CPCC 205546 TaxID=3122397 RepID=UPI002FEF2CE8